MASPSTLVNFWRGLRGSVHPADAPVFAETSDHTFDLRFPPPAYIGAVDTAPVIVLMSNGGFNRLVTPREFEDPGAAEAHRERLFRPVAADPAVAAPYYSRTSIGRLLQSEEGSIVNAVAYRSASLSREPSNQRLLETLLSVERIAAGCGRN
ncbi:hypothetical protein [Chelatococcus reniformis]|uniref:Uncharacterized protein n=1 Tax=Chelatococcus reniformis TaxID=1494448 RepID=A0A916XAK8_9HYPH|nr:hypothetical protein [Chelatococcus reniformis]GGC56572.1 hypothetical protein GCM10010994_14370 [Chelatococcus reniformis]